MLNSSARRAEPEVTAGGERLERLRAATATAELDAFLATSDESIAYLTGFRPLQLERFFAVIVRSAGDSAVIVPRLDEGQVQGAPQALRRVGYDASSDGIPELVDILRGTGTVGVEEDHLNFERARALTDRGFDLVAAGAVVMSLRARKDDGEIDRVREACALVEQALSAMFEELRPGAVERVVNARVEGWLRERGAAEAHPLILFGPNAANPHGEPGTRELGDGDVVCADLSARLDGYWGDITRCATVGAPSEWAQAAWQTVREAQAAAVDACRPGRSAREVDLAQRVIVEGRDDLGACLHGAGHAIGLGLHEPPFLVPRIDAALEEGMIFTIEPGLYRAGVGGIRLEDDVVVQAGDPQILSSLPLELHEVAP